MVSPNPAPSSSLRGTLISPRWFFAGSFDSRLVDLVRARGIDLGAGGRRKKARSTAPRFDDVYLELLVMTSSARIGLISTFLVSSVEDGSKFTTAIRERLFTSKINQPSVSLDGLISFREGMVRSFFLVHKCLYQLSAFGLHPSVCCDGDGC
ncbi:unnamed protein product [Musa hybrid cultivar]